MTAPKPNGVRSGCSPKNNSSKLRRYQPTTKCEERLFPQKSKCRVKDSRSSGWNWPQTFGKPSVICVMMGFWR